VNAGFCENPVFQALENFFSTPLNYTLLVRYGKRGVRDLFPAAIAPAR
jgi:hypothetical protein